MRKIMIICLCGLGFILKGASLEDIHRKNVESAIVRFVPSFTNDIRSMDREFVAILDEVKKVKSEDVRTNLLSHLSDRLIATPKDMWKHNDPLWFHRRRIYLMGTALRSFGDTNLILRWRKYSDLLRSMKAELVQYDDIKDPDAYRERWIAQANKELKLRMKELGTNRNIIISGLVPISKEEREIRAKWSYKCNLIIDIQRFEERVFDNMDLRYDYDRTSSGERKQLIEIVKEGLGRYPKWYREELEENVKTSNKDLR